MEGVEDIPGTALHEGIDWEWESFPEYLDALDRSPRAIDIAAQVPHAALRAYVMGERAHDEADARRHRGDGRLTERGARAPARSGFTTSRTILHSSKHGLVPGTTAPPDELLAHRRRARPGRSRRVPAGLRPAGRRRRAGLAARAGPPHRRHRHLRPGPDAVRADRVPATRWTTPSGSTPTASTSSRRCRAGRPGMLFGLQSSLHPFITHPTYRVARAACRWPSGSARLRPPEVRAALLAEEPATANPIALALMSRWDQMFPLGDPPDYEPRPVDAASPRSPHAKVAAPRRSCSTGCSSATARRCSSLRWPATSTATTTRSGR